MPSVRMSPVVCTTIFTPPCAAYFSRSASITWYVTRSRTGSSSASPPDRMTRPGLLGKRAVGARILGVEIREPRREIGDDAREIALGLLHDRFQRTAHVGTEAILVAVLALAMARPGHHVVDRLHRQCRIRAAGKKRRIMQDTAPPIPGRADSLFPAVARRRPFLTRTGRAMPCARGPCGAEATSPASPSACAGPRRDPPAARAR